MGKFRLNKYHTLNLLAYAVLAANILFALTGGYMFTGYMKTCTEYLCVLDPYFYSVGYFSLFFLPVILFLVLFAIEFFLNKKGKIKSFPENLEVKPRQNRIFKTAAGLLCLDAVFFIGIFSYTVYLIYNK